MKERWWKLNQGHSHRIIGNITKQEVMNQTTIVVLQNGSLCQTQLPLDVITEINKLINQNQLTCEALAVKHCKLQHRLNCKLGPEGKQLRFYRRRDLRYLFEYVEDIIWHHWKSLNHEDPDFEMLLIAQKYVKASLEAFIDCVSQSSSVESLAIDGTCSTASTSSSSYIVDSFDAKERVSVNDSYDSIELELFVPTVAFSDSITYHTF